MPYATLLRLINITLSFLRHYLHRRHIGYHHTARFCCLILPREGRREQCRYVATLSLYYADKMRCTSLISP